MQWHMVMTLAKACMTDSKSGTFEYSSMAGRVSVQNPIKALRRSHDNRNRLRTSTTSSIEYAPILTGLRRYYSVA